MNKETIYIEPSDDITDILSRLKASDKKVIALVPPKKPTVLLSAVNVKLIARTAKAEKKAVVIISTDDSLAKLAMAANLPVAPSLKSRPVMPGEAAKEEAKADPEPEKEVKATADEPEEESEEDKEPEEEESEEPETEKDDEEDEDSEDDASEDEESGDDDTEEDEDDKKSAKAEKPKKAKKEKEKKEYSNAFVAFLATHKPLVVIGVFVLIGLAGFLFWAFTIAPRVEVSVSVRTSSANFSENVILTKQPADEDSKSGKFYLREEKLDKEQSVKFTATGKKDLGEQASGSLIAYAYFNKAGKISIPAGTKFALNGFEYAATADASLDLSDTKNGTLKTACDNYDDQSFDINGDGCQVSTTVNVKAVAAGEDYNVAADTSGWTAPISGVIVYNHAAIAGGTSRIVTVVQQSDVDLALDKLKSESAEGSKSELYEKLSNTVIPIDASYKVTTTDPKSVPGVGEEVKDGVVPEISTKTTHTVYSIDRVRVEEFIQSKATIEEGKRLYSVGEPFIEYFTEGSDGVYTGKLKTTYKVGPQISETEVLEKIRGEKIGRIEPILKDAFPGVSSVKVSKSYFWVNSVPSDENKVKIELTVEE